MLDPILYLLVKGTFFFLFFAIMITNEDTRSALGSRNHRYRAPLAEIHVAGYFSCVYQKFGSMPEFPMGIFWHL